MHVWVNAGAWNTILTNPTRKKNYRFAVGWDDLVYISGSLPDVAMLWVLEQNNKMLCPKTGLGRAGCSHYIAVHVWYLMYNNKKSKEGINRH